MTLKEKVAYFLVMLVLVVIFMFSVVTIIDILVGDGGFGVLLAAIAGFGCGEFLSRVLKDLGDR